MKLGCLVVQYFGGVSKFANELGMPVPTPRYSWPNMAFYAYPPDLVPWYMHPASMHSNLDCAISGTTGWAFSWTSPLSPRPCWLYRLPLRLHKVNHKVNHMKGMMTLTFCPNIQGQVQGVSRVSDTVPFFEKNIFSKRAPIRRILGFWRSKVPQNGRFHAQYAASFIPGGEIRNRTKWQIYKQTKQTVIDISTLCLSACVEMTTNDWTVWELPKINWGSAVRSKGRSPSPKGGRVKPPSTLAIGGLGALWAISSGVWAKWVSSLLQMPGGWFGTSLTQIMQFSMV